MPGLGVPGPGGSLFPGGPALEGGLGQGGACSGGGVWSQGGACSVGGACSMGGAWWRPPRTATAAGSTHPTGMHSCLMKYTHSSKGLSS